MAKKSVAGCCKVALEIFLKTATSKEVLIVTDKSILADQLIHVVDQCRLGGAQQIAVATIKEVGL